MVILWVVYSLGISALLAAAAVAGERLLSSRGMPIRWVWTCAVLGSLALPAWSLVTSKTPAGVSDQPQVSVGVALLEAEPGETAAGRRQSLGVPSAERSLSERVVTRATGLLRELSPFVSALWLLSSLGMGLVLFGGWLRIRGKRARWRRVSVGNRSIMISRRTGPAVVGFIHPAIVLPEWAMALSDARRELVLLHEEEHLRAHDERLLLLAGMALIPMPWNAGLWYQVRRLRLAVEIDCDARVLRRHPDAREYGDLLLDVGRRVNSGALQMAALSEPVSFLARRVSAMVSVRKQSRAAASLTLALATVAIAIACQAPRPPTARLLSNQLTASLPSAGSVLPHESPDSTVVWDGERMTRDSLVRRLWGRTLVATEPATLEFIVDAHDVVVSAGMRTGRSGYSPADSSVTSARFSAGSSEVPPADVASIEIDPDVESASGIISAIWLRLKEGVTLERRGSLLGEARSMAATSAEPRRAARMTGTARDAARQRAVVAGGRSVDPNYRPRPGDKLLLTLTGDVEQSHRLEVSRSGYVVIPQVGYVRVANITLELLDELLYSRLALAYPGLGQGPAASTQYSIAVERETTTLEAEMAINAAERATLRARLRAVEAERAELNRTSALAEGGSTRHPASRSLIFPPDSMLAAVRKHFPELATRPPESPVTVWFLADTVDRVLRTQVVPSRLGTVGLPEVLQAFPDLVRERVRSWTVSSSQPFGMVWVRAVP